MISPNRENIDRWLFDYTEGNLSEDQVTILENYLLNNPDIEVDLDAWEDSKLVVENVSLPNKEKFKRKRKLTPFYFTITLILLVFGSFWYFSSSSVENNKIVSNINNQNGVSKPNKNDSKISSNLTFDAKSTLKQLTYSKLIKTKQVTNSNASTIYSFDPNTSNLKNIASATAFPNSNNKLENNENNSNLRINSNSSQSKDISNSSDQASEQTNSLNLVLTPLSLKKIDSKTMKINHYQTEEEESNENDAQNDPDGLNLDLGNVKLFQKIEKVLEKDLGLSNIPDHTYAIPEYSNVDVLFSNIGATSQFRFQSTSMGRWIEDAEQRKFSQQITLDGYSRSAQSGFGLQANYDYFANGSIQNWNTCLLFSPKIAVSRKISFEPALRFKIGNKLLNEERIENQSLVNFESQTSNQFNFDSSIAIGSKLWYRDLDLGFTINTPYFYL
jgi:hypothetical protein